MKNILYFFVEHQKMLNYQGKSARRFFIVVRFTASRDYSVTEFVEYDREPMPLLFAA
jgi:hypothetical protein